MHWMQRKKNLSSLQSTVFEKNQEKLPQIVIFEKMRIFGSFSWFFTNGTLQRAEVFCVAFIASRPFS